jgi:hypothetical protein
MSGFSQRETFRARLNGTDYGTGLGDPLFSGGMSTARCLAVIVAADVVGYSRLMVAGLRSTQGARPLSSKD